MLNLSLFGPRISILTLLIGRFYYLAAGIGQSAKSPKLLVKIYDNVSFLSLSLLQLHVLILWVMIIVMEGVTRLHSFCSRSVVER